MTSVERSFAKKSLLPPSKRMDFDGHPKFEYNSVAYNLPTVFRRQNGDLTNYANCESAQKNMQRRSLSPQQSRAVLAQKLT